MLPFSPNLEPRSSGPPEREPQDPKSPPSSAYEIALTVLRSFQASPISPRGNIAVRFTGVTPRLVPGRGLVYSLLVHLTIIFAFVFWPYGSSSPPAAQRHWVVTMIPNNTIFLPPLGGGKAGGAAKGGSSEAPQNSRPTSIAAASKPGVTYPGAQPIVSNPPNPTNRVQTILQPALPKPVPLKTFVPLPNMVKLAPSLPRVQLESTAHALVSQAEPVAPLPVSAPAPMTSIQKPKLPVPIEISNTNIPVETAAKPPQPVPSTVANKIQPSNPEPIPVSQALNARSLLVLSPMPASPARATKVPPGEARGQFAVAPQPNLAMSHLGPGSKAGALATADVGVGTHPNTTSHDATGAARSSPGNGLKFQAIGGELGNTSTPGIAGVAAAGNGKGSSTPGGRGPGIGSASGAGSGSGAGTGAFAGITIQGGEQGVDEPWGQTRHPTNAAPEGPEGSYSMTVVSNGNSGGGIKDFGVFSGEQTFTVYINMEISAADPAPSWILEYALMRASSGFEGALRPPFPQKKASPQWPAELAARYRGQSIVVLGVIDRQGNVLNMQVLQTPDTALNAALFKALRQWRFTPASVNGQPVAIKILLGVPLVPSH